MGGKGSGARPRNYPPEIVERVRSLYEGGMTQDEVQAQIGRGYKVETIMRNYGIVSRPAVMRVPLTGERNPMWKGDAAGYPALHLRVEAARGKPQHCNRCGRDDAEARYEWANLTGDYRNVDDYERMCLSCHRFYDAQRRKVTGKLTSLVAAVDK